MPETPAVDGRSRKPWEGRLCRATCGLRSVTPGDSVKKPAMFERHEVREMLAVSLVPTPGVRM